MTARFSVTYDVITEESATQGDCAESGFASPGGWRHPDRALLTLREAVQAVGGACLEDCGRWFSTIESQINYRTGEETMYAIHPPATITPASYRRLHSLLCR